MINGMRTQQLSPKRVKMPREHGDLYIGQDEVAQGHLSCQFTVVHLRQKKLFLLWKHSLIPNCLLRQRDI